MDQDKYILNEFSLHFTGIARWDKDFSLVTVAENYGSCFLLYDSQL